MKANLRAPITVGVIVAALAIALRLGSGDPLTSPNPFITLGIVSGAIYGLVALGLVLVYKGTRVFNFAAGEFGTLAAYFLFLAVDDRLGGLPYWLGIILAIQGVLVVGLVVERVVIRPLIEAPRITVLVTTIALALLLVGVEILAFKAEPRSLRPMVAAAGADGPNTFTIFDYPLTPQQLISLGVLAALGGLLAWFFSRTDMGLAVLATSQDSFATRVVGIGVDRMSRFIWVSAAVLGGIAGILYIPHIGSLQPGVMTQNILIPAFTAAVLGGMASLPGAFVGGVVVGVVQSTSQWASGHYYLGDQPWQATLPGLEQMAVLFVLLAVLLVRPQGLLGREA
ncbi:MAG: branched-chain amino acid ABC transporter permease [Actinomycetota bacterium]